MIADSAPAVYPIAIQQFLIPNLFSLHVSSYLMKYAGTQELDRLIHDGFLIHDELDNKWLAEYKKIAIKTQNISNSS